MGVYRRWRVCQERRPKPPVPFDWPPEMDSEAPNRSPWRVGNDCGGLAVGDPWKPGPNIFELFIIGNGCISAVACTPGTTTETPKPFLRTYRNGPRSTEYITLTCQKRLWATGRGRSAETWSKYIWAFYNRKSKKFLVPKTLWNLHHGPQWSETISNRVVCSDPSNLRNFIGFESYNNGVLTYSVPGPP